MNSIRFALSGLLLAACSSLVAVPAAAQKKFDYPNRAVRMLAGAFGSPSDMLARTLAPKMAESWGQPVVVENRPGAAGTIAASMLARSTPDGYTLLLISAQFTIGAALHASLPYDPHKDFAGVTQIGFSTSALLVNPALGAGSLRDFVALARSKPGQMLFSSGGGGSSTHLSAERFNFAAGIKAVHVGFKGTPDAILEVVAGRTHYCLVGLGSALPLVKDGRILPLAVSTPQRSPLLPDVPAIAEQFPGFGRDGSHSLIAPAGTPMAIREKVSREVARIFALPEVKQRMDTIAYQPAPTSPTEHDAILREQIRTFREIVARVGLKKQ